MKAGYWDFVGQRGSQITQAGQITIGFGSMIENLTTGSGHDTVFGNELGNKVVLGAGNDRATGGAGNDAIDGGAGLDTSVFTGVRSNYTVTLGAGQTTLKDNIGTDGTDTLVSVERLACEIGPYSISSRVRLKLSCEVATTPRTIA